MAGTLERVVVVNLRSRQVRNYTQALVAVYLSASVGLDVRIEMQRIASDHMIAWLALMQRERRLRTNIALDELSDLLANIQYAMLLDWCRGLINDERAMPRLVEAILLVMAGALRGSARFDVNLYLDDVFARGPRWKSLIDNAERAAALALTSTPKHPEPRSDERNTSSAYGSFDRVESPVSARL